MAPQVTNSNDSGEFENAMRRIANVKVCFASLLKVIYCLQMAKHYTAATSQSLKKLQSFVVKESLQQKADLEAEAVKGGVKKTFFQRLTGGEVEVDAVGVTADSNVVVEGGEVVGEVRGAELSATDSVPNGTEVVLDGLTEGNEAGLSGGKINELTDYSETLAKKNKDLDTITLLTETIELVSMAQTIIESNEVTILKEAEIAKRTAEMGIELGIPLEEKLSEIQFSSAGKSSRTINLQAHTVSIQTFNTTISSLYPTLHKLFFLGKNLHEDVIDTCNLVGQAKEIVFRRSAAKGNFSILKLFTAREKQEGVKSEMILNAVQSVFFNMDFVVKFTNDAFSELMAIEKVVDNHRMIKFSAIPNQFVTKDTSDLEED